MRGIIFVVGFLFLSFRHLPAQGKAWFVDETEAKEYAIENNVPIMVVFAGSDWCRPCMLLKKDILLSEEFIAYFPAHFAILYLDFPLKKKNQLPAELKAQNERYADKFNKSGAFPNIVLIDSNTNLIGGIAYDAQSPQVFITQCEALLEVEE